MNTVSGELRRRGAWTKDSFYERAASRIEELEAEAEGAAAIISTERAEVLALREQLRMAVADRDRFRMMIEEAFREGVRAGLSDKPGARMWQNSAAYTALNGGERGNDHGG